MGSDPSASIIGLMRQLLTDGANRLRNVGFADLERRGTSGRRRGPR
jgi:hypothetical protein